jgi:hypothetical membrane protein
MNLRKILSGTGMAAVVFYVIHVLAGGFLWKGYNHLHQPISDLTAMGAPNKSSMLVLTTIYGILALIFALSFTILESGKHKKVAIWGGIMFCIMHLISLSYGLFPQDLPGHEPTFGGVMHIVVTTLIVPFTILSPILIGFGLMKNQIWKSFGVYSVITGFLILIFGSLCAIFFLNKMSYFGLVERLNIGTLQVWTFIFSLKLTLQR